MFGWSASSRFARPDAPPVAQRRNSSTAAANDSVRASTSSRSAVHDGNPCSRAITDCASWSAGLACADLFDRLARKRGQSGEAAERVRLAGLHRMEQGLGLLLQLFEIGAVGQLARHRTTSMLGLWFAIRQHGGVGAVGQRTYDGGLGPSREPAGALCALAITVSAAPARVKSTQGSGILKKFLHDASLNIKGRAAGRMTAPARGGPR